MLGFNEIRKGKIVVLDDQPFQVLSADFLKKQQRRPVIRCVLRNLRTGQNREHTFMQSDKIQEADIQKKPFQYLYAEGNSLAFMDQATYEQVEIDKDVAGDATQFLLEGQEAEVVLFEGSPVSVELPIKIDRKVIEAPPGVKGDTSTNVTKEVTIEGNVKIKAPLFVNEGDMIRIDTRDGSYVERA